VSQPCATADWLADGVTGEGMKLEGYNLPFQNIKKITYFSLLFPLFCVENVFKT
jgi:hypothetical protein